MQSAGLYVHVPFCKRKCLYCDFYSAADMSRADDYVRAVIRNIKAAGLKYDTVYFGGGTPSLLTAEQISDQPPIFRTARKFPWNAILKARTMPIFAD